MNGLQTAVYYKYYLQFVNPNLVHIVNLSKIRADRLYAHNQVTFDKLAMIFSKYNLDIPRYIQFVINRFNISADTDISKVLDPYLVKTFLEYIQIKTYHKKVYQYFLKSVKNIVDECLELNIMSTKDYFMYIIKSNKLAGYFVTGKISAYYLAAIPNFRKIIESLDSVSKAEFSRLYNHLYYYYKVQ